MFEFGKDIRKLFAQARDSDDLSWTELVGVEMLASEARNQKIDAGRISCARPHPAWLRAAALWREHARRSGSVESLTHAVACATDAAASAKSLDQTMRAAMARAEALVLDHDLCGGPDSLMEAVAALPPGSDTCRPDTEISLQALHARIQVRQARLLNDDTARAEALAYLGRVHPQLVRHDKAGAETLLLEAAALRLEVGIQRRDGKMLDQAGRELQTLVETASPDYRPLTRARALSLCAGGLSALAALATDTEAHRQGRALFKAAADQFTPDHSPLDWATIQLVRAEVSGDVSLSALRQVVILTGGQDLILGAIARDRQIEAEVAVAVKGADLATLTLLEDAARSRLARPARDLTALGWAVDQMAMVRLQLARAAPGNAALALPEVIAVLREFGVHTLAKRARALMKIINDINTN